jgi:hypothetical protein
MLTVVLPPSSYDLAPGSMGAFAGDCTQQWLTLLVRKVIGEKRIRVADRQILDKQRRAAPSNLARLAVTLRLTRILVICRASLRGLFRSRC